MKLSTTKECRIAMSGGLLTIGCMTSAFAQSVAISSIHQSRTVTLIVRPQDATPVTTVVLPGQATLLDGYVEYNPQTCAQISSGTWTPASSPAEGTVSYGTISAAATYGPCTGTTFTYGTILYTLEKSPPSQTDAFSATWTTPDGTQSDTDDFTLVFPSIRVVSQSIAKDSIVVNPEPAGISGGLLITAVGDMAQPQVVNQTVSGGAQISLKYGETTAPLPASHYSELDVAWTVNGVTFNAKAKLNFTALGNYENTVYNVPAESMCSGALAPVKLYDDSDCQSSSNNFKSDFISQTYENGTGIPLIGGYVHHENHCIKKAPHSTFQHPYTLSAGCSGGTLNDKTIAAATTQGILACGDKVLFVGENVSGDLIGTTKTVTDGCPACAKSSTGTSGHVDNFSTSHACSASSLPAYQAIIVGD